MYTLPKFIHYNLNELRALDWKDNNGYTEKTIVSAVMYGEFQGGPQLGPPEAERRQSLGQL